MLTEAEYERIRHALFDCPPGQSAEAAKVKHRRESSRSRV